MSFSEVEYSRIRPQPVQVRLQVCNGSSCSTVANFFVRRSFWPMMYAAILVVNASGNLIVEDTNKGSSAVNRGALANGRRIPP